MKIYVIEACIDYEGSIATRAYTSKEKAERVLTTTRAMVEPYDVMAKDGTFDRNGNALNDINMWIANQDENVFSWAADYYQMYSMKVDEGK